MSGDYAGHLHFPNLMIKSAHLDMTAGKCGRTFFLAWKKKKRNLPIHGKSTTLLRVQTKG